MHTVYLEQVPLSIIWPFPLLSFKQHLVGFIMLSSYVYMQHISIFFTHQYPFLSPLPPIPLDSSPYIFMSYYYYIFITILGLGSTIEWVHVIFGLLHLVYVTQLDDVQFHPFSYKWHHFIFLYGWVIFHSMYICMHVCMFVSAIFSVLFLI
jgi:hypothetical protein